MATPRPIRLLHVFPTFEPGGAQVRTVTLINQLGESFAHSVMALDGRTGSAAWIDPARGVRLVERPAKTSPLYAAAMRRAILGVRPDVTITYNWGAIDAVMASLLGRRFPVVHTEDGFGPDEASGLKARRVITRQILLPMIHLTVVPSRTLLRIAREQYRLSSDKVRFIPNAVDLERFRPGLDRDCRGQWDIAEEEVVFGYVGHLRAEKNLGLLIRAFARAAIPGARLVLVGDGPCRAELETLAAELRVMGKVIFAGLAPRPEVWYAAMDVFTLSSMTEQMPVSLLEAMACGRAALCTAVGDVPDLLGTHEPPAVTPPGDVEAYAEAMRVLARSAELRGRLGAANRERCAATYSLERMTAAYAEVYRSAAKSQTASIT